MTEWLAEATSGWVGRVGAARLDGRGAFVLETISGELPDELAAHAEARGGRLWLPFSTAIAEALLELRGARLDKRALRCAMRLQVGQAPAPATLALVESVGEHALHARRQLGPGHDPRLPRPARVRGARPLAADRPLPDRAARALPARARRRGRAERRRGARAPAGRARRGDRGRPPLARPRAARRFAAEARAGRRAAPVPARGRRLRAARPAHVPRRRAGARQDGAGAGRAGGRRRLPRHRRLPGLAQAQLASARRAHWLPHRSVAVVSGDRHGRARGRR